MSDRIHSYGKIFALGHGMIADLFHDPVVVEEKIDGSQFSFRRDGETVHFRSKNVAIHDGNEGMFALGCAAIREIGDRLREGWTYRGEYLQKPKHNGLAYDRIPARHVMLFDIDTGLEMYVTPDERRAEAGRIGLESVPVVYAGTIDSPRDIFALMEGVSCLGGQKPEGLVFKNYHRAGPDKKLMMGKHVSEEFKEVQRDEWKKENPKSGDILEILGEKYRTPARWNKAVQHLRERGEYEGSPRDISALLKEVQNDVTAECADEIREQLYRWAIKHVLRKSVAGLPEWYKSQLVEAQFAAPANDVAESEP